MDENISANIGEAYPNSLLKINKSFQVWHTPPAMMSVAEKLLVRSQQSAHRVAWGY